VHLHELAVATGYLGASFGVAMVVPQIVRTFRNRAAAGVSPTSWSLTALACLCWLMYGIRAGVTPQIPGNILLVTGASIIVVAVPARVPGARRAVLLGAGAAWIVLIGALAPPEFIGYFAFAISLVATWPQTVQSITRARSSDDSAVSMHAWMFRAASQVCWLAYAIALSDVPVTVAASVTLLSALVVLTAEARRSSGQAVVPALA
jgi:uncharacterized protein with PQ loop repeat